MVSGTDDEYERYEADRVVLAEIGRRLFTQPTRIEVRIPDDLAHLAVDAWSRDDEGGISRETPVQERSRTAAAFLALIGLAVEERGTVDGNEVIVALDAWQIGEAFNAAESLGLLSQGGSTTA